MCAGSKPAITIGRWRFHSAPFAAKTPPKPISREMRLMRSVRWKPSGRSRSTAAIASGSAIARKVRLAMRKRKKSPYLRRHASAARCIREDSICSALPNTGSPAGPGRSLISRRGALIVCAAILAALAHRFDQPGMPRVSGRDLTSTLARVSSFASPFGRLSRRRARAHPCGRATVTPIFVGYSSKHRDFTRTLDHLRLLIGCLRGSRRPRGLLLSRSEFLPASRGTRRDAMHCTNARGTSGRWTAAGVAVLAPWLWSVSSAAADDAASLRALADAARTTLAESIEPPVARVPFLCTVRRTETAPMREYILRQQAEAIEALLASASAPAEAKRVRRLLDELRRKSYSREANARLADTTPGGATGLRLAASLGELPAALDERLRPGGRCGTTYVGVLGRTFLPLGALARADYQRLAELEPADLWHTLVLAWLAGIEGEPALQRPLAAAQSMPSAENARVQILAWQQLAWLRLQQGRAGEAQQAASAAMRMAEEILRRAGNDLAQPAVEQALRYTAQSGSVLALILEDSEQKAAAFQVLLGVASQQKQLAELRPEELPVQLALIDTLGRLAVLRDAAGPSAATSGPAKVYLDEAVGLYRRLEQRTPYSSMFAGSDWPGIFWTGAGMASGLTLIAGWALLWRYRRRIARLMMASARGSTVPLPPSDEALPPPAATPSPPASDAAARTIQAAAALRRAAIVQVAAGLAFGVAAAWLWLRAADIEPSANRMALITWAWAWPTVLALGLVWDGDRRRRRLAWTAYLAGLLLICTVVALGDTPPITMFGVTVPAF